jgi:hypothetical protein
MNERIRELAEQAGLKVNADGEIGPAFFGSIDAGYKKFAELIVKECVEIVEETRWMVPPSQEQIARSIKQHFGVEE